jgi:hypothetical protein
MNLFGKLNKKLLKNINFEWICNNYRIKMFDLRFVFIFEHKS